MFIGFNAVDARQRMHFSPTDIFGAMEADAFVGVEPVKLIVFATDPAFCWGLLYVSIVTHFPVALESLTREIKLYRLK